MAYKSREVTTRSFLVVTCVLSVAPALFSQGTLADYQRAQTLQAKARNLVVNAPGAATSIGNGDHFWYPRSVKGGTEFILVDAGSGTKKLAFDHGKLAAAVSAATAHSYTGLTLPFAPAPGARTGRAATTAVTTAPLTFLDGEQAIEFGADGSMYRCTLTSYECKKEGPISATGMGRRGTSPVEESQVNPEGPGGDPVDGLEYQPPAPQDGDEGLYGRGQSSCAPRTPRNAQAQGRNGRSGARLGVGSQFPTPEPAEVCASFDGKWEAFIQNFNVFVKSVTGNEPAFPLSFDGSEGNYYTLRTVAWSPDSKKIAAYHTRPGYDREVFYIESSPTDQVQPKHTSISYRKPGDALDIAYPALFDVASRTEIEIDHALFPNPYSLSPPMWWKDSRGFTFEYNQRGHQAYTVIEVDAQTGKARPLISEVTKTFFYYNSLGAGLSAGRKYRFNVNDGKEIIWASERDGWEHLYLYDGTTGQVKNQITKGNWVVRNVDFVDSDKRQIWFEAGGMNPDQDPYFTHYYRINFDGTGLTKLTEANGTHTVTFSRDRKYYVDSWQRVDLAPVAQLRRTEDQKLVTGSGQG